MTHRPPVPSCRVITAAALAILYAATFAEARECLDCHQEVGAAFSSISHHVQGTTLTGRHCYACHWEADADGTVNVSHHQQNQERIDLVIWQDGVRPQKHLPGSTAVVFSPAAIGTAREREEIAAVTMHCLGCHSDADAAPFAGDPNRPSRYAWDGQSIASRYNSKETTGWGKYSTAATNRKSRVTKALSAHGNAAGNQGGWSAASGYDGSMPMTRGGSSARNIECFDCHNAHGSSAAGVTTSYPSFDGRRSGGLLKDTATEKSGYKMSYRPAANSDEAARNPYSTGAGLCFDCHETAAAGATPWGYRSTFGTKEPVIGYKDTPRFGAGVKGSTSRYSSRQGRSEILSSHLRPEAFLRYSATSAINGLCTPCHDPHGVSTTLGDKRPYGIPLLKGTWLTSPYREDAPPTVMPGTSGQSGKGDLMPTGVAASGTGPISMPGMKYFVDRNTFGEKGSVSEDVAVFAGLCLKCHPGVRPNDESKLSGIHRSVKGWGANREHSFPCAKCHQAHNSGLPHLMQTNCFEEGPAGLRDNIGLSWLPAKKGGAPAEKAGREGATTPAAKKARTTSLVGCHVRQFGRGSNSGQKQENREWQEKTRW